MALSALSSVCNTLWRDKDALLERCSKLDRWLLLQRYAAGMAMKEIAERHSMTAVAIRVRLHRAKQALRQAVEPSRGVSTFTPDRGLSY